MNTSKLFRLNLNDFEKGLIVAVLTAFFGALQQAFIGHGLEFYSYDWMGIFNLALIAATGYLSKNLMTSSYGVFLGAE